MSGALLVVLIAWSASLDAQTSKKRTPAKKAPAPQPAPTRVERDSTCPSELGVGVKTEASLLRRADRSRSEGGHPHGDSASPRRGDADPSTCTIATCTPRS